MTTSIMYNTVSPSLIITTPAQLLAVYMSWYKALGFEEPELSSMSAGSTASLIEELKKLNSQV